MLYIVYWLNCSKKTDVGHFLDLKGKERSSDTNTSVNFSRKTAPLLLFLILILLVVKW